MRSAMWENIFHRTDEEESETALALRHVPVFADLSKREIRAVEKIVHSRDYKPGETVFQQGDPGLGMYIVITGQIQIVNNADPENPVVYSELNDGDFFGDLALVDDSSRSASAIANADTRLVAFFSPELKNIITRFPGLGNKILMNLAKVIAQRLRKTNDLLIQAQQQENSEPSES